MIRTYSELITLPTFEERFEYLKESAKVGEDTFGWRRYLNQVFYTSTRWRKIRNGIILRDDGLDLGAVDHPIGGPIYIHHINPLRPIDIEEETEFLTNPEYLICVSYETHNALHYGSLNTIPKPWTERRTGDTKLW